jgi:hypothetical protein
MVQVECWFLMKIILTKLCYLKFMIFFSSVIFYFFIFVNKYYFLYYNIYVLQVLQSPDHSSKFSYSHPHSSQSLVKPVLTVIPTTIKCQNIPHSPVFNLVSDNYVPRVEHDSVETHDPSSFIKRLHSQILDTFFFTSHIPLTHLPAFHVYFYSLATKFVCFFFFFGWCWFIFSMLNKYFPVT